MLPLASGCVALDRTLPTAAPSDTSAGGDPVPAPRGGADAASDGASLVCTTGPGGERWLLVAGARHNARVNGLAVLTGARVLTDRDELALPGHPPMFFSAEAVPAIEPFPGTAQPIFCPRCKQAIEIPMPAVRCPQCRVWHHQSDDLPCWTYGSHCALCAQVTNLDAGLRWLPEER
jgi:hypothetical protein